VVLLVRDAGRWVDGRPPLAWRVANLLDTVVLGPGGRVVPDADASPAVLSTRDGRSDPEWVAFRPRTDPNRHQLDHFLDLVWLHRARVLNSPDVAYSLYKLKVPRYRLTGGDDAYLDSILAIRLGRPEGARTRIAATDGPALDVPVVISAVQLHTFRTKTAFVGFVRAGAGDVASGQRLYLSPRPDAAAELMRALVREVLDDPSAFPGVLHVKIAGPSLISIRADGLVVYVDGPASADRVIQWLRGYVQTHPETFDDTIPMMPQEQIEGVGRGDSPLIAGNSFGELRAFVVSLALRLSRNREEFTALVRQYLRYVGVDPDRPHANLQRWQPLPPMWTTGTGSVLYLPSAAESPEQLRAQRRYPRLTGHLMLVVPRSVNGRVDWEGGRLSLEEVAVRLAAADPGDRRPLVIIASGTDRAAVAALLRQSGRPSALFTSDIAHHASGGRPWAVRQWLPNGRFVGGSWWLLQADGTERRYGYDLFGEVAD